LTNVRTKSANVRADCIDPVNNLPGKCQQTASCLHDKNGILSILTLSSWCSCHWSPAAVRQWLNSTVSQPAKWSIHSQSAATGAEYLMMIWGDSRDLGHPRQLGCDDFDVWWFDVTLKTSDMSGSDGDTILNKEREANMHCILANCADVLLSVYSLNTSFSPEDIYTSVLCNPSGL